MFVKRFFEPSIAQASYLIGCARAGEAIVIDANRDVEQYSTPRTHEGLRITQVTETHIHADFVSGSRELAQRTGATLCLSDEGDADWKYQFPHDRRLKDGDRITIGNVAIDVAAHARPHARTPHLPDHRRRRRRSTDCRGDRRLPVRRRCRPPRPARARRQHQGDDGEGRRGRCGGACRSLPRVTTGCRSGRGTAPGRPAARASARSRHQRSATRSASTGRLRSATEDEFVDSVLAGQPEPPKYFATMKKVNKEGPAILNGFHVPGRLDASALAGPAGETGAGDRYPSGGGVRGRRISTGTINIPAERVVRHLGGMADPAT